MIIGITGKAGAGKDTVAGYISRHAKGRVVKRAMADALKRATMFKFDLSEWHVFTEDGKKQFIPWVGATVREILQKEGTEYTKPFWGEDFWVRRIQREVDAVGPEVSIVVPDIRFDQEAAWVQSKGGVVIEVIRPDVTAPSTAGTNHVSESGINPILINHRIINKGSLRTLSGEVQKLLIEEGLAV